MDRSSAIVQQLQLDSAVGNTTVAYFYFDYADFGKRSVRSLLLSVISQILMQAKTAMDELNT